jgi:ATP-dependent DNA helicase RecG
MEKAGRGSVLMVKKCLENGLPSLFWNSVPALGIAVTFPAPEVTPEVVRLLRCVFGDISRGDLQEAIGLRDAEHFREACIDPALELNAKGGKFKNH